MKKNILEEKGRADMGKPIVVFGSFAVDLISRTDGMPAPGQTVLGRSFYMGPGGKGSNQAVAAFRAGADVTLVTKLGMDMLAEVAMDFYKREGMSTEYILRDGKAATGTAQILVDETTAQNEIVVVPGACSHITREDAERCRSLIEHASILLLQHEIQMDAQKAVIEIASQAGVRIILNPAPAVPVPEEILARIDTITPNETEARILTGITVDSFETARKAARVFQDKGVRNVVITMGAMGAYADDGEKRELLPCMKTEAIDTTGAGDAFNGAFATALSEGKDIFEAMRYGNAAGALAVTRQGTAPAMALRSEIEKLLEES